MAQFEKVAEAAVVEQQARFVEVFSEGEADLPAPVAIENWMQTFYRRPRPDVLFGALRAAVGVEGALTGNASFGAAVFLSHVINRLARDSDAASMILGVLRRAVAAPPGAPREVQVAATEKFDTVLRALYLADRPEFDDQLTRISEQWQRQLRESASLAGAGGSGGGGGEGLRDDLMALATSLCPPPPLRRRLGLLGWPVPSLNIAKFEHAVTQDAYPLYGATRYLFQLTRAAHVMAKRGDKAAFAIMTPSIASEVTKCMVDGYWSTFYATGNPEAVYRVLDVGTPYMDFVNDYGDKYVTEYRAVPDEQAAPDGDAAAASGASPARGGKPPKDYTLLPEEFADDPYNAMRFETSRYALWTLIMNASTHTAVSEIFNAQHDKITSETEHLDPMSYQETVTAFGEKRLLLMGLLRPAIDKMAEHAGEHGIGSGYWPESYTKGIDMSHVASLFNEQARALAGGSDAMAAAPVLASQDVTAALFSDGSVFAPAQAAAHVAASTAFEGGARLGSDAPDRAPRHGFQGKKR